MKLSMTVLVCCEKYGWRDTYNGPRFSTAPGNFLVGSSAITIWVRIFRGNFFINLMINSQISELTGIC